MQNHLPITAVCDNCVAWDYPEFSLKTQKGILYL